MVTKTVTKNYILPYSEYDYFSYDFQIIIAVAKKQVRPTFPSSVPPPIKEIIELMWHNNPENRPTTLQLYDLLLALRKKYLVHKEEWEMGLYKC